MNACNKLNEVKQKISEERKIGISSKVFPMLEQQRYYLAQMIRIGAEPYSTENSFVVANNYAFVHHLQSKIDCIPK
ncbi:hypothetical protein CRE_30468 [Caenorhabditis remanei]|uniref:Uncharacterized protein n=1 Tax=Caenorhabditis remanei TaxID=31234 RepID=E3NDZ0_CAERE|nr:hypothetical protein CRE_30468 [Caenorhabditis remanei]